MNIKDKNYVTIQGWMRTELDLKGNDLIVYALIYGFCQSENQKFNGSLQYIADWCGATKQGVMKNLQNLISKGLIIKESNYLHGVNIVEYYTTEFNTPIKHSLINNTSIDKLEEKDITIINNSNTENDFLGQLKKKTKRKSLYEKCYDRILEFTNNVGLIDALTEYLQMRLQMKEKPLYENSWKGMLNKLAKMDNQLEVVNTSIERGWASFFEQKSYSKSKFGEDDNIKSVKGEFESSGETF